MDPAGPPPRKGKGRGWGWIAGLIALILVVWVIMELWDPGEADVVNDAPVAEEVIGDDFGTEPVGTDGALDEPGTEGDVGAEGDLDAEAMPDGDLDQGAGIDEGATVTD